MRLSEKGVSSWSLKVTKPRAHGALGRHAVGTVYASVEHDEQPLCVNSELHPTSGIVLGAKNTEDDG